MNAAQCWGTVRKRLLQGGLAFLLGWPLWAGAQPDQAKLVSADNGFAFGLLKELSSDQPAKNVFISPYSIAAVLEMVCNGAAGSTREQMASVLGTSDLEPGALNQAYKDLDQSIRSAGKNVTLNIANAIWYSKGTEVKPGFAAVNKDCYGATLDGLDFTNPRAPGIVNAWAAKNTHGRIKNIAPARLPADTRILLANAIYFKGTWQRKFDAKLTKDRPFNLAGGRQTQVPMMEQRGEFQYQEGGGCQAVRLPYVGGRLGLYVLLPETHSSVVKLLGTLNDQMWQHDILDRLRSCKGSLVLPKFKLEYGASLKQPLEAMGMKLPFSPSADFSAMSSSPLFLSAVEHKSFVEVNEQGTEAAAATVGVMSLALARPVVPPFEMVVDRPFLFVIGDNLTKSILFIGVMYEPASAGG
jgi:serine protease inhibitor